MDLTRFVKGEDICIIEILQKEYYELIVSQSHVLNNSSTFMKGSNFAIARKAPTIVTVACCFALSV